MHLTPDCGMLLCFAKFSHHHLDFSLFFRLSILLPTVHAHTDKFIHAYCLEKKGEDKIN